MDTRTKRMGQTNTDKNKKRGNRVHAFKTLFFIDIQKDMVKDKVSPTFGETQIGMVSCTDIGRHILITKM